jgi:MFS family permease
MFVFYVLLGIGIGLVFLPSVMIINQYFNRKRSLANGILTSGAGIGLLVMASVTEKSIEAFGWRGSLLVCASFTVQLCVCASLMRPFKRLKRKEKYQKVSMSPLSKKVTDLESNDVRYTSMPFLNRSLDSACGSNSTSSLPVLLVTSLSSDKDLVLKELNKETRMHYSEVNNSKSCTLPVFLYSKPFLFLCIGCLLTQMGQYIPLVFIGDYGNHVGVTSADIGIVLSTFGKLVS